MIGLGFSTVPALSQEGPPFILEWGSYGSGDGQFSHPFGVAVDAYGDVYVVDGGNDRVQKFTTNGEFIAKWGSYGSGDAQFNEPFSVAVDASGDVYVTDRYNHRIQKFTEDGDFITKRGSSGTDDGEFQEPMDVEVDDSGQVFVTDLGNARVQVFTTDGDFITKWGTPGNGPGEFGWPMGVTVDNLGDVYVSELQNNRIQVFTDGGEFLIMFGVGEFAHPAGIAYDQSRVHVPDYDLDFIKVFDADGTLLLEWGESGSGPGQFNGPTRIAFDSGGDMFVTDQWNNRIQKFGSLPTPTESVTWGIIKTRFR